jgi:hypothetical protein
MSIQDQLAQDLKEAMRTRDETRKGTIRMLRAAIGAAKIDKRAAFIEAERAKGTEVESLSLTDGQFALSDEEVLAVLQKQAKQRRDSIAEFEKGGRADLVAAEKAELDVVESYLPRQMTREEIEAAARQAADELGIHDMPGMGALMKHLMAELKGRADGRMVNQIVREVLSRR